VFIHDPRTAKEVEESKIIIPEKEIVSEITVTTDKQLVPKSLDDLTVEPSPTPFNFWQVTPMMPRKSGNLKGSIQTQTAFNSLWSINCPSTRSVYRQQILSEFLYSYYDGVPDPSRLEKTTGGWLTMLPTIPNFTTALEASILAVCTARLGRVNGDKGLVRESLKFYTQGLWELQKALWSPSLMYREETVAACMALLMYEVVECPDKNSAGWQGHIKGCARLVELRGPKAYESEFAHRLFVTFRQLEASNTSNNGVFLFY
jgi:hypothetical protein